MSINFELLDLRAFLAVFDHASFNKAAELLNLSQPALSRCIQGLEARLGVPLLERVSALWRPTQPLANLWQSRSVFARRREAAWSPLELMLPTYQLN